MPSIRCCTWNANGVRSRIAELRAFIQAHNLDLILLNETKLTPDIKIKIKGFQILRKDRTAHGGGVAIIIRNNVPFIKIKRNNQITIENICIELNSKIIIAAVYNQPRNNFTTNDLELLADLGRKVLIIGDLNARHHTWNNHVTNLNGRTLYNFTLNNNLIVQNTARPTHFPDNGTTPTTIDIILNKNVSNNTEPKSISELNSDHNPVTFEIHDQYKNDDIKHITSYKNTDWSLLRQTLNDQITINNRINSDTAIDTELDKLTTMIQRNKAKFSKRVKIRQNCIELNEEILELIKTRNTMRKTYQRQYYTQYLKTSINRISRVIKNKIRQCINEKWEKTLEEITPNDRALWRISKSFRSTKTQIPTLIKHNTMFQTDKEKANAIGESLQDIQKNNERSIIERTVAQTVNEYLQTPTNVGTSNLTSPKEISDIIKKLPSHKSPGLDEIDNKLIKNLPRKAIVQLTYIINAILNLGYYPIKWKTAVVIPIPKPDKNLADPTNYRPISLLSSLSKVCEKVILRRIEKITIREGLLRDEQFGFRSGHSTSLQVARIAHDIITNYNKDKVTSMALLDIAKAFDTVWIDGIIYKLIQLRFPNYLIVLLNSYLRERNFKVKVNQSLSDTKQPEAGVPQGSVLGPVIFLFFINDMPDFAPRTSLAIYADDTSVYAHSFNAQVATKQTQLHTDQILHFANKWKIKINKEKTEHIIFARKFTNLKVYEPLKVEGTKISQADQRVKYLGVVLDKRLSFSPHIKSLVQKGQKAIRLLYPLLNRNSKLSPKNKKLLYTAVIRPSITYAAPVWCGASKTSFLKLERIQNKCLRLVLNADRYTRIVELLHQTNLETITDYVTKLSKSFYKNHIRNSSLTRNITDPNQPTLLPKYKHKFTYHRLNLHQ